MPGSRFDALPVQPMRHLVATTGYYPSRDSGRAWLTMGMVHPFAGNFEAYGAPDADGRVLPATEPYGALFSLMFGTYGGNGRSTFALPDLRGRAAAGGPPHRFDDPPDDGRTPRLAMTYAIAVDATYPNGPDFPAPMIGMVALFAGNFVPHGWLAADGDLIDARRYSSLTYLLGTTYGGDGQFTVGLPNLNGRVVIGAGAGPAHAAGDTVSGAHGGEAVALNYHICVRGELPPPSGMGALEGDPPWLGHVIALAGPPLADGLWMPAAGQAMLIAEHRDLYSVLGNAHGGDGTTTFALPDLRGKVLVGR